MEAIGILESNSIAKGIEAADAVLKAATRRFYMQSRYVRGNILFYFTGMWRR